MAGRARSSFAPAGFRRAVVTPAAFVLWLLGALFGIPAALAAMDLSTGWAGLIISAVLLLPVIVLVAVKGSGRGTGHRGEKIVFFSAAAVLCFVVAAAALVVGGVVGAVTCLYVGLFFLAIVIAIVRSPGSSRPGDGGKRVHRVAQ